MKFLLVHEIIITVFKSFLNTALRYNSHITETTHLNCTTVFIQSCTAITTTNFRTFSSSQEETTYPLAAVTPHSLLQYLQPQTNLTYLLSL